MNAEVMCESFLYETKQSFYSCLILQHNIVMKTNCANIVLPNTFKKCNVFYDWA